MWPHTRKPYCQEQECSRLLQGLRVRPIWPLPQPWSPARRRRNLQQNRRKLPALMLRLPGCWSCKPPAPAPSATPSWQCYTCNYPSLFRPLKLLSGLGDVVCRQKVSQKGYLKYFKVAIDVKTSQKPRRRGRRCGRPRPVSSDIKSWSIQQFREIIVLAFQNAGFYLFENLVLRPGLHGFTSSKQYPAKSRFSPINTRGRCGVRTLCHCLAMGKRACRPPASRQGAAAPQSYSTFSLSCL